MSITREQLREALSEVEFYDYGGIAEAAEDADHRRYKHAVKLLADVARGEEVIDFCRGSGDAPDGDECSACLYKHGLIEPNHYVER